ncbi:MAG TPA: hypothetical protein VF294_04145, partial [Polyangiaceae bacterium]
RRAVASVGKLHMSGFIAWLAWLTVHIFYLIDFRNRVVVLFDWAWSYFTYQRGSRLITGHRTDAGAPVRAAASAPLESGGHRLELHGEPLKLGAHSGRVGAE